MCTVLNRSIVYPVQLAGDLLCLGSAGIGHRPASADLMIGHLRPSVMRSSQALRSFGNNEEGLLAGVNLTDMGRQLTKRARIKMNFAICQSFAKRLQCSS